MKITEFDRQTLRAIRTRIEQALEPIATELGIGITMGHGSFSSETATLKLELGVIDAATGEVSSNEARSWELHAPMVGLPKDGVNKTFTLRGNTYVILGWADRRHKNPIIARDQSSNKRYVFRVTTVKLAMGIAI